MSTMFEAVTITPELAGQLLAMNTENRRLRPSHVAYLARAIERGEWQMPPDAIMVSDSGRLLNGQHRLTAVVRSGKPIQSYLVAPFNVMRLFDKCEASAPDSLFMVMDCGVTRGASDRTGLAKGVCELVTAWCKARNSARAKFSSDEILECYATHRAMFDWAHSLRPKRAGVGVVHVWVAFMEFFLAYPDAANTFVTAFVTETDYSIQQAALLRTRLIEFSRKFGTRGGDAVTVKYSTYNTAIYCVKKWMEGKTIKSIVPCEWDSKKKES
jgi:hypothetical protein